MSRETRQFPVTVCLQLKSEFEIFLKKKHNFYPIVSIRVCNINKKKVYHHIIQENKRLGKKCITFISFSLMKLLIFHSNIPNSTISLVLDYSYVKAQSLHVI